MRYGIMETILGLELEVQSVNYSYASYGCKTADKPQFPHLHTDCEGCDVLKGKWEEVLRNNYPTA